MQRVKGEDSARFAMENNSFLAESPNHNQGFKMTQFQKKGTSGIVIGLIVLVVILCISNAYVYASMYSQILILNSDKTNLTNQLTTLTSQKNTLNSTYQNYLSTHSHNDTQYNTIKSNYDVLNEPKLSSLSISMSDNRPFLQTPYLHIFGEVWNVGNKTAYNSKIHVTLYQGAVVAQNTDVLLGPILGENRVSVDQQVFYSGDALTSWSYSLIWTP